MNYGSRRNVGYASINGIITVNTFEIYREEALKMLPLSITIMMS